jgi:hypothetical protein
VLEDAVYILKRLVSIYPSIRELGEESYSGDEMCWMHIDSVCSMKYFMRRSRSLS